MPSHSLCSGLSSATRVTFLGFWVSGHCCLSRCHHVLPPLCSPMALQGGNPQPSPRVAPALEKPGLATFSRESDLALTAGLWGQTGLSVNWIQCTCDLGQNSLASLSPGACIEKEELPPAGTVVMLA